MMTIFKVIFYLCPLISYLKLWNEEISKAREPNSTSTRAIESIEIQKTKALDTEDIAKSEKKEESDGSCIYV